MYVGWLQSKFGAVNLLHFKNEKTDNPDILPIQRFSLEYLNLLSVKIVYVTQFWYAKQNIVA